MKALIGRTAYRLWTWAGQPGLTVLINQHNTEQARLARLPRCYQPAYTVNGRTYSCRHPLAHDGDHERPAAIWLPQQGFVKTQPLPVENHDAETRTH